MRSTLSANFVAFPCDFKVIFAPLWVGKGGKFEFSKKLEAVKAKMNLIGTVVFKIAGKVR